MELFCKELPKVELHAHLNGSLSQSTMRELRRLHADSCVPDDTNAFDEYLIDAGDKRNLSDCFQVFSIAHSLTSTPAALKMATLLTLKEFEEDGCCYIELRSTPRETLYMTCKQYVETLIETIRESSAKLTIISRLILSINRSNPLQEAEETTRLAIEFHKKYPDVVVGIDLSGNPNSGQFQDFIPALRRAKTAGLKITLHCGEIRNSDEIFEMLQLQPHRIGHGICIHPNYGGTQEIWNVLCKSKIPVEICLTSNIKTKSVSNYDSHHFKVMYDAHIPIILGTDDKGVFATSLSHEYYICAETFQLDKEGVLLLAKNASQYIFSEDMRNMVNDKLKTFQDKVLK